MATPVSSITVELALSIVAIFISILSSIWGVLKYGIRMENRLTRLETKTELWWNTVADQVKGVLQQPTHFRKDDLLDRFPNIINQELVELKDIIVSELTELKKTKDPKVASYAIWKARVELECLDRYGKSTKVESLLSRFCDYCSLLWRTK
jgi:hypothetical protein